MKNWSSLNEFFHSINRDVCYVILRNYEDIKEDDVLGKDTDIDILCSDVSKFVMSAGSIPISSKKSYRSHHKIFVKNQIVNIDIKYIGDGYYDKNWEEDILNSRVLYKNMYYIPSDENSFYSLLYHSLIHKEYSNNQYFTMLNKLAKSLGNHHMPSFDINSLIVYMKKNGYYFEYPADSLTTFNFAGVDPSMINNENRHLVKSFLYKRKKVLISAVLNLIKWGKK